MQIRSADFVTSARGLADCPAWDFPEFAFIGRSNVGKSSLVNAISNRRALAKVSGTPGKTREINLFLMNGTWSLVDLPGYGYAKVAKTQKADFMEWAGDYLEGRPNLRRVFVLIDSRHPPQRIDLEFIAWLETTGKPFSLVFTKADKQSPTRTRANIAAFFETSGLDPARQAEAISSSAKTRDGRDEILRVIGQCLD